MVISTPARFHKFIQSLRSQDPSSPLAPFVKRLVVGDFGNRGSGHGNWAIREDDTLLLVSRCNNLKSVALWAVDSGIMLLIGGIINRGAASFQPTHLSLLNYFYNIQDPQHLDRVAVLSSRITHLHLDVASSIVDPDIHSWGELIFARCPNLLYLHISGHVCDMTTATLRLERFLTQLRMVLPPTLLLLMLSMRGTSPWVFDARTAQVLGTLTSHIIMTVPRGFLTRQSTNYHGVYCYEWDLDHTDEHKWVVNNAWAFAEAYVAQRDIVRYSDS